MPSNVIKYASVHPHACGEIVIACRHAGKAHGTSPRLWGDLKGLLVNVGTARYIPTLVGRFPVVEQRKSFRPVHPHACGEISIAVARSLLRGGTSPRLWGDWAIHHLLRWFHRYIPTLVGRFVSANHNNYFNTVHPHACGEIPCIAKMIWSIFGALPLRRACSAVVRYVLPVPGGP